MNGGIYQLVPKEHLDDVLTNLSLYTGVAARLIEPGGLELMNVNLDASPCPLAMDTPRIEQDRCADLHRRAGQFAVALGEAYIYACPAGLNHIAYPLMHLNQHLATVILGPFLLEGEQEPDVPVMEPARVTALSRLMNYIFQAILPAERAILLSSQVKAAEQRRIGEAIQMYKYQAVSATYDYFYEKELELIAEVKTGDTDRAKALLNDLLGYVLFSEGWNVSFTRLRAIELTTLLSRVALEGGASTDAVFALNEQFLSLISAQGDIEEISILLLDVVEGFMNAMFNSIDNGNLHIRKALKYIAAHYQEPLLVGDVAAELGLSGDYFASLFRATVGQSFHMYLMQVRVERSKTLLLSTNASLADIALATGFSDQSYFCRVFKKVTGISPGRFRR